MQPQQEPEMEVAKPDKREKKGTVVLTAVQEVKVADWVRDNEALYNKAKREYKDKARKDKLWLEKLHVPRKY